MDLPTLGGVTPTTWLEAYLTILLLLLCTDSSIRILKTTMTAWKVMYCASWPSAFLYSSFPLASELESWPRTLEVSEVSRSCPRLSVTEEVWALGGTPVRNRLPCYKREAGALIWRTVVPLEVRQLHTTAFTCHIRTASVPYPTPVRPHHILWHSLE